MGTRAQVKIQEYSDSAPVYLYTHWGANGLVDDVKTALKKKQRWSDYEYLARIIFDTMKGNDTTSETGYGIGTSIHGDIELLVDILPGERIRIREEEWTFEEFINT